MYTILQAKDDHAIFLDIDMSVLALSPAKYARYAENIRREYANKSLVNFLEARAGVLRRLLQHDYIYHDAIIREELQTRAKNNIISEIGAIEEAMKLYAA
jgi:predicted metal-dependent HD superfamily phosphohydrolase